MTLSRVWTFLCLLAAASAATVLYPSLGGSETLTCECPDHQCQKVYWYRFLQDTGEFQFLMFGNSANAVKHAEGITATRFKLSANEGAKITYSLRITGLEKNDAGIYSCMFNSPKHDQKSQMPAGYYIRPGEHAPTSPPPTVKIPKKKKPQVCPPNNQPVKGCKPLVLWPSVGVLLVLAVVLISTLYYFSRLPKKCRHQYTKKMQL
ncbi:uncharacterized protein LOC118820225 [Colossoma macropomum]|uniref:uncharacterized protein LOC118820225 n=1 Tax=Colossoma macropomum TaxID=42526 RepID=UPI0018649E19|nr:uncharacterized protein LOC118820225 [Colossoma macropomum]